MIIQITLDNVEIRQIILNEIEKKLASFNQFPVTPLNITSLRLVDGLSSIEINEVIAELEYDLEAK